MNHSGLNPVLLSIPPPLVAPPPLWMDHVARGREQDLNISVSSRLSRIASHTNVRNRRPYGTPFRGPTNPSGAVWVN